MAIDMTVYPVIVEFEDCDVGWIHFSVKVGSHEVAVRASEVFDPFPDLIAWLEAIVIGVQECTFMMEEEGPEKRFEYRRITYKRFRFRITDNDEKILLEAEVDPKQLISAFYYGIKGFSASPKYNKLEWEDETLLERIQRVAAPTANLTVALKYFLSQTREKIIAAYFKVAPRVLISFPDAKDGNEAWSRSIDAMVYPDDPNKDKGMVKTPQYWNIPEDFDSWPVDKRKAFLEEDLDSNVSNWCGTRLGDIKSEIIEKYLGHAAIIDQDSENHRGGK